MNYIFSGEQDINDIFIKVLNRELKQYILTIRNNKKYEVLSSRTYLHEII